jgi:hypothetical protein
MSLLLTASFISPSYTHETLAASPASKTEIFKTVLGTCFELDPDFIKPISMTVRKLQAEIDRQKNSGKLIAYISIPLSARGGGYRPLNVEISSFVKNQLEAQYGGELWALAPGQVENELPTVNGKHAAGGEYLYMWTQVLAGEDGMGRSFDLVWATGPNDLQPFFGHNRNIVAELESYIDDRSKRDHEFQVQIASVPAARRRFVAYYATKAAVSFSDGSHDEWNIFVEINRNRRNDKKQFGIGEQIPIYFDGRATTIPELETRVSVGYEQKCTDLEHLRSEPSR